MRGEERELKEKASEEDLRDGLNSHDPPRSTTA
jgi:hypothetical protein